MPLRLITPDGSKAYDLRDGVPLIVGRAPTCDLPVFHPTISRRHAELTSDGTVLSLRDLGSSNGTFVNGAKIDKGKARIDDLLAFGKVGFRLESFGAPTPSSPNAGLQQPSMMGATIVRQIPMPDSTAAISNLDRPSTAPGGLTRAIVSPLSAPPSDKSQQKLATLLEVSKGLTRAVDVDTILDKIVGYAYGTLEVDRVAILLCDESGELVPKIARDKRGGEVPRSVPQSIARQAVADKVALLTDNAGEDERFGGQSIVMQQVRSAICAPLVGSADRVLGVLYVDNPSITHRFSDDDLEFLVAFAGIAAVAIENSQFAERIRREGIVRSNFERYFAPQLAARIADSAEATKLGQAAGRRAVQRHPGLYRAVRDDEPGRDGDAAHGVLHRDGGVRVPSWRDVGQVHRGCRDGAVGRAPRQSRRRRPGHAGRRGHDDRARRAQRALAERRAPDAGDRDRAEPRGSVRREHRIGAPAGVHRHR
jgi:hypothetical protein